MIMSADCALQAGLGGATPVPAATAAKPVGSRFTFGSSPAVPIAIGAHRPSETAAVQASAGPSAAEVSMFYKCPTCHHLLLTCSFGMVFNATV